LYTRPNSFAKSSSLTLPVKAQCSTCYLYMPWYNGDYRPSYKKQPVKLREKAVGIANALLEEGAEEGIAIATGLKRAREYFKNQKASKSSNKDL
jgi:hypothetical protein